MTGGLDVTQSNMLCTTQLTHGLLLF